jgi:hypothetical protein
MEVVLLVHHHLAMQQCCNARSSSNIFNSSKLFRCRINNISNYLASNSYTFAPTGPTVGAGGLVSGMTIGTSYMFTSEMEVVLLVHLHHLACSNVGNARSSSNIFNSSKLFRCRINNSNYLASNSYTFAPTGPYRAGD